MFDRHSNSRPRGIAITRWLLIAIIAYALSFGPACWMIDRAGFSFAIITWAYRPLALAADSADRYPVFRVVAWYADLGTKYPGFLIMLRGQLLLDGAYGPIE